MEDVIELLKKIGLTEYEAKVYLTLLNRYLDGAARLSSESQVPRTKIYSVLESLENKGWVRVLSGYPLLFRPIHPKDIFEKMKNDYSQFLDLVSHKITNEVGYMMEKFVVTNYNIGMKNLKEEVKKAKTVWISNATHELLEELTDSLSDDAEIKVVLFPGEKGTARDDIHFRESAVKVINLVKGKETPSMAIAVDEERIFTVFKDPTNLKYIVSEMLYDDCTNCFREWNLLGWNTGEEVGDRQSLTKEV